MSSGSPKMSIPKMIQHIKEIAKNHGDDEIYAMLKECSMDPNETAQKLLLQDTFHEVKRKRDKKKELPNNRESANFRWRPGTQGRGGRGGRGNYFPRFSDDGVRRNANTGKENRISQDKSVTPSSLPASQEIDYQGTAPASSSVTSIANGPTNGDRNVSRQHASRPSSGSGTNPPRQSLAVAVGKHGVAPSSPMGTLRTSVAGVNSSHGQSTPSSNHLASPVSVSGVYSSASDPVLVPSSESRTSAGTIKREVGSQRTTERKSAPRDSANSVQVNKFVSHDLTNSNLSSSKAALEVGNSFTHSKTPSKSQGERNQLLESSRPSSTHGGSSTSRPSSNYSSRSQQVIGSQKVGPSKEWKPKSTAAPLSQSTAPSSEVSPAVETSPPSLTASSAYASEESTLNLKKLEELHLDCQHVILPNNLHVSESERNGLSFGSFDAGFGVSTRYFSGPDNDKSSTPPSESSLGIEGAAQETSSSNQSASQTAQEGDVPDPPQSPKNELPESAGEADVSSNLMPEYDSSKQEGAVLPGLPQYSVVHTAPHYSNFGFMSPILGTHFPPFDSSDAQSRDVSRLQNIVVQPYDAASYYTQFYRPAVETDGRFSPSIAPGVVKYNGNMSLSSIQCGQSPQEGSNSVVLSTSGPTSLVTQATGVMQSSIPMTPQPVPIYRHPAGVHISHYPHGYFPYSQYFPPYFGPPPTIHQFLSNNAFPQQTPAGNLYQAPTATAAMGVKPSISQYKPGTNAGNSTHNGMATGYGPYSSAGGYSPTSASTTGNSSGNEELATSQYKDNNVYLTGQQSEGSAGWIPTVGRDISGLQANSFYSLPQGQQMTFAPPQAGHGGFPSLYHPGQSVPAGPVHPLLQQSQTVAGPVEMAGPTTGVYQQPQRTQVNWNGTY